MDTWYIMMIINIQNSVIFPLFVVGDGN